jgi:hypothetical protein
MILYEGPSRIDGKPIVVIMIGSSKNSKTGNMVQTYILRSDISPVKAVGSGEDASICGDCPHRGIASEGKVKGRSCYVTVFQGPFAVWNAYKRGKYAAYNADKAKSIVSGKMLRLGTYGDPAACPMPIWRKLTRWAKGSTGYTHQWKSPRNNAYRLVCMASVDHPSEISLAKALGYRYFRVRSKTSPVLEGEIQCPASQEQGKRKTCEECGACWGANHSGSQPHSVTIIGHGSVATVANVERTLLTLTVKGR